MTGFPPAERLEGAWTALYGFTDGEREVGHLSRAMVHGRFWLYTLARLPGFPRGTWRRDPSKPHESRRTYWMIPVFVISLPDCHDRRAGISAALDGLGLPFEFADAVDGRRGLPPERESEIDRTEARRKGNILTDAEFACALSHIDVYRRIVADGIPYALVLEDDAVPRPDLVPYLAGRHYEGAELTQLSQTGPRTYVRRSGAKSLFGDHRSYLPIRNWKVRGAFGYVISQCAARHFVENALPVIREADWPDCHKALVARREWRVVSPALVRHEDRGASVIDGADGPLTHPRITGRRKRRRFLGVYVPHFRKLADSYRRAPLKLFGKRLPTGEA